MAEIYAVNPSTKFRSFVLLKLNGNEWFWIEIDDFEIGLVVVNAIVIKLNNLRLIGLNLFILDKILPYHVRLIQIVVLYMSNCFNYISVAVLLGAQNGFVETEVFEVL